MQCPKCEGSLNKVKVRVRPEYGDDIIGDKEQTSEIELDQCLICNGVWFDQQELDKYLEEKLLILDSPKVKNYRALSKKNGICPKCNQPMIKKPAPKGARLMMDVCERCKGVWLDSSELDKLEDKNFSFGEKSALVLRNLKEIFGMIFNNK